MSGRARRSGCLSGFGCAGYAGRINDGPIRSSVAIEIRIHTTLRREQLGRFIGVDRRKLPIADQIFDHQLLLPLNHGASYSKLSVKRWRRARAEEALFIGKV